MWISKKKWQELGQRVADLEKKVQDQPLEIISTLCGEKREKMKKSSRSRNQGE